MRAKEKVGISTMLIVIVISAIIIVAAVATAGWWFFLRPAGKEATTIDLALYLDVPSGQNQNVSGLIEPAVADATVTLTITKPDGSTFNVTVTSGADGWFTYTFTVEVEGNWSVTASWPGNNEFKGTTSTLKTFTVSPPLAPGTSRISCFVLPSEVEREEDVTISGQIWTSPTGAGAGVTVTLTFTRPGGSTFTATVTSESDGTLTYTYSSGVADLVGWWGVTASWAGTAGVAGAISYVAKFHILPVFIGSPIKFGIIGPMEWIQGVGMREGAQLAADEINEAGGILGRKVVVVTGDEGSVPARGTAEMERLCDVEKVQFVLGGFRTEICDPMREVAVGYKTLFAICGSATPWLIDCISTQWGPHEFPCGHCVRCDYENYKYLFRMTPTNTDILFTNFLVPYIKTHLIPNVLNPGLGIKTIKVACVIEALDWTADLRKAIDAVGPLFFGPFQSEIVSIVDTHLYYGVSPLTTDFTPILADMEEKGAQLIFEVFSGEEGLAFIKQLKDLSGSGPGKLKAVPVGINVLSQMSEMWGWTAGGCEYEAFLATMGTKTPIVPGVTDKFWDDYTTRWGHAPIYTAFGTYEGLHAIADTIKNAASEHPELKDPAEWENLYDSRELYDILIPYMEASDREGVLGRSKFTGTHDIFTGGWLAARYGVEEYVKPLAVQWQGGEMVAVSAGNGSHVYKDPVTGDLVTGWAPYVEEFQIPPWMLPPG